MSRLQREAIVFQYTDWDQIEDGYLNQKMIADVVGDYFFICPTNHFAQQFADNGMKVYYYYFTQRTSTNLWGEWMGVMHGDEIEYVFGHPLNMSIGYNDKERELSLRMMQAFARFALTGKPMADDASWPPYRKEDPKYFLFHAEKTGIGKGPRTNACAFWNQFLPLLAGQEEADTSECVGGTGLSMTGEATLSGRADLLVTTTLLLVLLIASM